MSAISTRRFEIDEPERQFVQSRGRAMSEELLDFDGFPPEVPRIRSLKGSLGSYCLDYPARAPEVYITGLQGSTLAWQSGVRFYQVPDHDIYIMTDAAVLLPQEEAERGVRGFVDVPAPVRPLLKQQFRFSTANLRRWAPSVVLDRRTIDAAKE